MTAAAAVIVIAGLREVRTIALPLIMAVFLSVLSAPLLSWLVEHRVPKLFSVLTTVLANILVVVAILLLVGSSLSNFARSLPQYQEQMEEKARSAFTWLEGVGINTSEFNWLQEPLPGDVDGEIEIGEDIAEVADPDGEATDPPATRLDPRNRRSSSFLDLGSLFDVITSTLRTIASLMTMIFLVFLIMIFILFEANGMPRKLQLALGWEADDLARMTRVKSEMQHYLVIKSLISFVTGVVVFSWVWWMGIDNPLLWGLIAFFLNYIPSLGSILASIPAMALALVQVGPGHAILLGIGYLAINLIFGNFVEPHLMGRQLGMSTLIVFMSLLFWGWVWGPVGMLLAVPLTMNLKIFLEHTEDFRWLAQLISAHPLPSRR